MKGILWWLAQNALATALLIPVAAAVSVSFRRRPAVQHAIWVILLFKFLTPPIVSWPWTVGQLWPSREPPGLASGAGERAVLVSGDASSKPGEPDRAAVPRVLASSQANGCAPHPDGTTRGENLTKVVIWMISTVWLLGMAMCAVRQSRRIARHAGFIRRAARAPRELAEEIESVARLIGLRPPRALVTAGIASPFVWFAGRLRLIWPEAMSSREAVVGARGVIAHELAHVRRGDHLVAWLELVAGLVWWWNPLFWFVRRRCRESAELACDALALAACPDGRRSYAELLLQLSTGISPGAPAPVLGWSAGSRSSFERRLSMILSDRVSGKLSSGGIFAASVLALAALPGWSFAQKPAAVPAGEAMQTEADPKSTAARLEQIENELKRLASLVEHAERAPEPDAAAGRSDQQEKPTVWRKYKGVVVNNGAATFESNVQTYAACALDKTIDFYRIRRDRTVAWHRQVPGSLPARLDGGHWVDLQEAKDWTQVIFTWTAPGIEHIFRFDAPTGDLLSHDVRKTADGASPGLRGARATLPSRSAQSSEPVDYTIRGKAPADGQSPEKMHDDERLKLFRARLHELGYLNNENPPASKSVKKLQPSLSFATGENRIYILSVGRSAEGQCFLSAQTNQAEQVWRSTFPNPLEPGLFRGAWRAKRNGPPPDYPLAGTWTVQESDDGKLVIVSWSGKGVDLRIRFVAESGKILGMELTPEPRPEQLPPGK